MSEKRFGINHVRMLIIMPTDRLDSLEHSVNGISNTHHVSIEPGPQYEGWSEHESWMFFCFEWWHAALNSGNQWHDVRTRFDRVIGVNKWYELARAWERYEIIDGSLQRVTGEGEF